MNNGSKITTPKSIEAALNYNENKVQKGTAVCLHAANYLKDAKDMNFYQKLNGFARLNSLNERAATQTLHVSLNFDPSEKLSETRLSEIASAYMEKIGFGEQPFWFTSMKMQVIRTFISSAPPLGKMAPE